MEYTIQQLAQLAGVTRRTLRWYDQIGLLTPARTTPAGYRVYGPAQVDRLQQILLYRALGLDLASIRTILDCPGFQPQAALQSHLEQLEAKRAQLDALILTVRRTLNAQQGGIAMTDTEKFECFKRKVIKENRENYGAEVCAKYGAGALEEADARLMARSKAEYDQWTALGEEIQQKLERAVSAQADPAGAEGRDLALLHRRWCAFLWEGAGDPKAHAALAALYTEDPRFTAYYDRTVPGCARFLRAAVEACSEIR